MLGQALDQRLIDKVQIYVAPILTGGPIVAFAGAGADSTQEAPRLARVRYEKIGQDICVTGYPTYDRGHSRIIFSNFASKPELNTQALTEERL